MKMRHLTQKYITEWEKHVKIAERKAVTQALRGQDVTAMSIDMSETDYKLEQLTIKAAAMQDEDIFTHKTTNTGLSTI